MGRSPALRFLSLPPPDDDDEPECDQNLTLVQTLIPNASPPGPVSSRGAPTLVFSDQTSSTVTMSRPESPTAMCVTVGAGTWGSVRGSLRLTRL